MRRLVVKDERFDARAVLQDNVFRTAAVLVLLGLAITAWVLFPGDGFPSSKTAPRYTHMHCPECGDEVPYTPTLVKKQCVSCGKGTYTPTVGPVTEGRGGGSQGAKLFTFLLLGAFLLQGLAFLAVWRLRALRQAAERTQNRMLICRCPFCKRKLGYPAAKVGTGIICTLCKTAFTLPAADQAEPQKAL